VLRGTRRHRVDGFEDVVVEAVGLRDRLNDLEIRSVVELVAQLVFEQRDTELLRRIQCARREVERLLQILLSLGATLVACALRPVGPPVVEVDATHDGRQLGLVGEAPSPVIAEDLLEPELRRALRRQQCGAEG
jgi:hypothetical protein